MVIYNKFRKKLCITVINFATLIFHIKNFDPSNINPRLEKVTVPWYHFLISFLPVFFLETKECISDPCQHNSDCVEQIGGYTCECAAGYSGTHCENGMAF